MIDLRAARENPEALRAALARKGAAERFDELLLADERWRALLPKVDELRGRQKLKGKPTPEQLEELNQVKEELREAEAELAHAANERDALLERIPNPPDPSTPDGNTDDDAEEIRRWGTPGPEGPEHTEVGDFEMERAARISGARFGFMLGDTALLAMALYRFALDRTAAHGHTPALPPVLVREEAMYGTGFFPTDRGNIYALESDALYLTGTSEVALAGLHMGEILEELPLRYAAFSPCFRRESGAAGKDTRGMFRVHQFNKVEMFVYCEPSASREEHDRILAIEEELVQALDLPYRVVNVAAGDLGDPAAKKYDIEAWFPSQQRYREITSTSNTTDFQARRLGIRYRAGEKQIETPHTLNGTAVTDRWLLAILENFRGDVPEVLREYGAPARVSHGPLSG
ncbi:MAG TPA: serine--tRNA ligase [Gaiellaceae bacterium]|nr:serine--tRNA ligase [Gaiellaceae bacterium]